MKVVELEEKPLQCRFCAFLPVLRRFQTDNFRMKKYLVCPKCKRKGRVRTSVSSAVRDWNIEQEEGEAGDV